MNKAGTDWVNLCQELFEICGKKSCHISELVEAAEISHRMPVSQSKEDFVKSLSSFLARNVKSKAPQFARVKNARGGFAKGMYRIRKQKSLDLTPPSMPDVSTQFTGAGGEYAVLSELLFRGFNASKMTVDDGIDIIASKDEKYFHIQVKTSNWNQGKPYQATIRQRAFRHASNVFYIVVLRTPTTAGFVNTYVIFPSSDIRRLIAQKVLKDGNTISLRISVNQKKFMLAGSEDITHQINDFNIIC